ncbi:MAG TPA: hypothetical protein VM510_14295 [Caulifigura sp.]|jgi:hypothetical protein|nr:hypothetical protein [Caulifigura sp.]
MNVQSTTSTQTTIPTGDVGGVGSTGNVNTVGNDTLTVGRGGTAFDANDLNLLFDSSGQVNNQLLEQAVFKLEGLQKNSADIFTLMALMVQMGKEQREGARHTMGAEHKLQQAELMQAADKMREAADMALAAAVVSGVFKMASGAGNIAGGMFSMNQLGKIKGDDAGGVQKVTAQGRMIDGGVQIGGGVGDTIAAGLTHASTNLSADQKEAEARAQQHDANADREKQFMQNLNEMISKITGLIQDIQQSNNESAKRAASV